MSQIHPFDVDVIPGFKITRVLGQGAVGIVYLARSSGEAHQPTTTTNNHHSLHNPAIACYHQTKAAGINRHEENFKAASNYLADY